MDMRCFIAVNLDDSVKNEIDNAITGLKKGDWDVKWVSAENLHLTLKFLGETPEDLVQKLKEKLPTIAAHHDIFKIRLQGIGIFPDKKRPRVIWIDILDSDKIVKLQEEVEVIATTICYNKDSRPFSPHLTIGRVRSQKGKDMLLKAIETLKDKDFGNINVNKFSLMMSDLKPTGAQYTTLAEFHLNKEER